MMKMILLAGTMIVSAPALAQTTAPTGQTAPGTMPSTMQDSAAPTATTPMQDPATTSTAPTTGTTGTTAQAGAQAGAQPGAAATTSPTQTQVAQVVDQQFATYDKDGNGALSKTEFAAWMTALKSSSPSAKPASPAEETAWNDAAFKQADGDKSATVTKTELTSFLVKGSTGAS